MTPEGKVKAKIKVKLKTRGVQYFMPRGTAFGQSGVADFICCYKGFYLSIEAKAGKNKPTPLQLNYQKQVRDSGGYALIINELNLDDIDTVLEAIDRRLVL